MSIITSGLGSTHIITQGYGRLEYLVRALYETLTLTERTTKFIVKFLSQGFSLRDAVSFPRLFLVSLYEAFRLSDLFSFWKTVIEVIPPVIRRVVIPVIRRPWEMKIWILGSPKFLISFKKTITGFPMFFRRLPIRAVGNLRSSFKTIRQVIGSPNVPIKRTLQIIGSPVFKVSKTLRVTGNALYKYSKEVLVKGKKAFKRFFEILK